MFCDGRKIYVRIEARAFGAFPSNKQEHGNKKGCAHDVLTTP
jgi:hypothetical protein